LILKIETFQAISNSFKRWKVKSLEMVILPFSFWIWELGYGLKLFFSGGLMSLPFTFKGTGPLAWERHPFKRRVENPFLFAQWGEGHPLAGEIIRNIYREGFFPC